MTENAAKLQAIVEAFVKVGGPYQPFYRQFMQLWSDGSLSETEEDVLEPIYELVYMGDEDGTTVQEPADGIIPATELRRRLRKELVRFERLQSA